MNINNLKEKWVRDEIKAFKGWDFSYLDGRWEDEKLSWDYKAFIHKYLKESDNLKDMGTGGGEFLLSLNHTYNKTSVTEGWEPNYKLCIEKLEPLDITVKQVLEDDKLPFKDNTFDIVINRHESYDIKEVKRVLKNSGIFITQQVGEKNNNELSGFLLDNFQPKNPDFTLEKEVKDFKKEEFDVLYNEEYFPYLKFFDVGALVFFAKIIKWEFPNFSVEKCFNKLLELESRIKEKGYIESREHRFIIVAKNNK